MKKIGRRDDEQPDHGEDPCARGIPDRASLVRIARETEADRVKAPFFDLEP